MIVLYEAQFHPSPSREPGLIYEVWVHPAGHPHPRPMAQAFDTVACGAEAPTIGPCGVRFYVREEWGAWVVWVQARRPGWCEPAELAIPVPEVRCTEAVPSQPSAAAYFELGPAEPVAEPPVGVMLCLGLALAAWLGRRRPTTRQARR